MKTWRRSFIFVLLLFLPLTYLVGENGDPWLWIVVSDFDFDNLTKEDMIEYVDYLTHQIDKTAAAEYDLDVEVARESGKFEIKTARRSDSPSFKYSIEGVLKRSERGYAVVIRVTEADSDSRETTFEYAYSSETDLYSDCSEIAVVIANWIVYDWISGGQKNEGQGIRDDSYDPFVAVGIKTELGWISATSTTPKGCCLTLLLTTTVESRWFLPFFGVDFLWSKNTKADTENYLVGIELNINYMLASAGLSLVLESTPDAQVPYLGFRVRLLDMPPLLLFGFDFLPFTVRWNLKTGKPVYTLGIISLSLGVSNL